MIELNLLPDVKQEFVRAQRLKRIIISGMVMLSIGAVAIVALLAFYVYGVQSVRHITADSNVVDKVKELKKSKNLDRNLTIQNQLSSLDELHNQKNDLSRSVSFLTQLNPVEPNNAIMSTISIDVPTNAISLQASVKDYKAIAVLNDTFNNATVSYTDAEGNKQKKKFFTEVSMSEAGVGKGPDGQSIAAAKFTLTYEPEAFAWNIKNPVITVPFVNTTPSAKRVSIFSNTPAVKPVEGAQ